MEDGKRLLEYAYPRRVKQRIIFNRGESATLFGFEAMWKTEGGDLTQPSLLFANDAFIRNEYVEIYDLIRKRFAERVDAGRRTVDCSVDSRLFRSWKIRLPSVLGGAYQKRV